MSLTQHLKDYADQSALKIPKEKLELMLAAIQELENSQITSSSLKTGKQIPEIILPNATNNQVSINEILDKGKKVVLAFYRGGWCPYCNLELKALQEVLPEIEAKNATLVAITPEIPDNSLSTIEKNKLSFEVLTDENNELAKKFNLVYQIPKELNDIYLSFGINLEKSQNNSQRELPIAATYVVDTSGEIIYDFVKADYKKRAEPLDILKVLDK
ncbi:peroxiredoxin-like family protein [Aquimarina agarilytica]|uniref:peroxiredoxin-like family protein n=1 Tax=Aquimarina agarilytica TaxID=1087449 RepID=UPI000289EF18|nr:peroxiredoxin-like family protein [Aquimarina agarilytica]